MLAQDCALGTLAQTSSRKVCTTLWLWIHSSQHLL